MARSEARKLKAQSTVLKGAFANGLTEARSLLKMVDDAFLSNAAARGLGGPSDPTRRGARSSEASK